MERIPNCRIVATKPAHIYGTERTPLLTEMNKMFTHPAERGEAAMGALKKHQMDYSAREAEQAKRSTHPDYDDEVCDEQMEALRKAAAPIMDQDEWTVVDGPAW